MECERKMDSYDDAELDFFRNLICFFETYFVWAVTGLCWQCVAGKSLLHNADPWVY